jgi:hypothetical protein
VVAQSLAQFVHGNAQTVIEVDCRVRIPKPLLKGFAGYDLAGLFEQRRQELERLGLKADANAGTAQLSALQIGFKYTELYPLGCAFDLLCCHECLAHPGPKYTGNRSECFRAPINEPWNRRDLK